MRVRVDTTRQRQQVLHLLLLARGPDRADDTLERQVERGNRLG